MTDCLKLVFYIHALAGGGAERVWSVLASSFVAQGHEVILVVDYEASQNDAYLGPGVRVAVLGGSHWQTLGRLRRLLRREQPDIVVSALAAANLKLTLAALLAGQLSRTVLSFHGYAESEPQRLSQWGFRFAPILSRITAQSVCVSIGLLDYLRRSWGASRARTRRIYNPVLAQGTAGSADLVSLQARPPLVLAAGRFTPYKNFDALLRAFAAADYPDARLVLLGDGPERGVIEAEAKRLGLGDRFKMPGYVPEPWHYFEQAKCFVMPSRSESFGLVLVEAMAHGLEVVTTDCHGPREILDGGRFGTLVPHDDLEALTVAIVRALNQPSDPAPRMARARSFSVEAASSEYEALFRQIVDRSVARRRSGLSAMFGKAMPPTSLRPVR